MQPRRTLLCGLLFLVAPLCVLSQESGSRFEALKQALALSDAQMSQLQQRSKGLAATGMLDDSQRAKLANITKILDRFDAAAVSIAFGLITEKQWPGGPLCVYPFRTYVSTAFDISQSQIEQIEQIMRDANKPLWVLIRAKAMRRSELLNSGASADAPEVVELGLETNELQVRANARPPREAVLAILDDNQKAKLAVFETELQVAREAIALGLIPAPVMYEILCH
jgi:hypothetical protein